MTELKLYNTLTRSIAPFAPRTPGLARVYSCGPTVYSRQHLGNMRPYVLADLLTRVLRLEGLEVRHVINITDVGHLTDDGDRGEDKLELAAATSGTSACWRKFGCALASRLGITCRRMRLCSGATGFCSCT